MEISTSAAINDIGIEIVQKTRTTASVEVQIDLVQGTSAQSAYGSITLNLPLGITFASCPSSSCANATSIFQSWYAQSLTFNSGTATNTFTVNARNFGVNFDRIDAYAAIPDITLHMIGPGSENPQMFVIFNIPSAAAYDWSSFPAAELKGSNIGWGESLTLGDTPGRITVGTNHARQATDADLNFLAGALIGVAGAAFLVGIQEALHASDTN